MADFGLAAQIGRGAGGGAGGIQQVDPANRMAQMLQIQQAQQNMMLQQELAARQRQLFPLEMRKLEQTIRTQGYLGDTAGVKAREAGRAENVYTRLLQLRKTTPAETLATPEFRARLATTDPELADQLNSIVSNAEKTNLQIKTAGYNADAAREARKKAALSALTSTVPGIVDQSTFDTVLAEVEKVDPTTVKLTGRKFTTKAKEILEKRLRGLSNLEIKQDPDGNWVLIDPDKGTKTVLGPAAAAAPADTAAFGDLTTAAPAVAGRAQPLLVGPAAASLASPNAMMEPGAAPIIRQRQPPVAPTTQPTLGPAAEAARQRKIAELSATKQAALPKVQSSLVSAVSEIDRQIRTIEDLESRSGLSMATGPIMGRLPNVAPLDITGASGAQALIDAIKATGGLTALQELRRNSPTGGALGNVSDAEGTRLENSVAPLLQTQSTTDFRKHLATYKKDLQLTKNRLRDAFQREYGISPPDVAKGDASLRGVKRTGTTSDGRRVIEYSDGAIEYAD